MRKLSVAMILVSALLGGAAAHADKYAKAGKSHAEFTLKVKQYLANGVGKKMRLAVNDPFGRGHMVIEGTVKQVAEHSLSIEGTFTAPMFKHLPPNVFSGTVPYHTITEVGEQ